MRFARGVSLSPRPLRHRWTLRRSTGTRAESVQEQEKTETAVQDGEVERVTKKWGLEAGLFKVRPLLPNPGRHLYPLQAMTSKDQPGKSGGQTAKELLAKYGSAYLITSISFAIVSFAICYFLVDFGKIWGIVKQGLEKEI